MTSQSLVSIGSGNGLVPGGTKALPEQYWIIINEVFHLRTVSVEMVNTPFLVMGLEITNSRWQLHLPDFDF